jgi:hypothetical protein
MVLPLRLKRFGSDMGDNSEVIFGLGLDWGFVILVIRVMLGVIGIVGIKIRGLKVGDLCFCRLRGSAKF